MPPITPFAELALLLMLAAGLGTLGLLLRQPLIVGFIAVGLIAGPSALDVVRSDEQIRLLSELGIALLLFLVGIKLDIKLLRSFGSVAVTSGLAQVVLTFAVGFLAGLALGLERVTNLYIALGLAFSSTIIIVKLLSDKREIDALHGQIALGFLIVQDLVVVLTMILLSATGLAATEGGHGGATGPAALAAGLALVAGVAVFARCGAGPITEWLARMPELLVLFALALAATVAAIGEAAGLGKELGGLLAGVALASTSYRETIAARLAPLRDFLLLFFFIALGASLDLALLGSSVGAALILSLLVLVGKPLIVIGILLAMGYGRRTAFLAGITMGQISEFSLILMAMGVSLGHVGGVELGLVTLVGLITITVSTYMITYANRLYDLCEPILNRLPAGTAWREPEGAPDTGQAEVIVFGLGRFGTALGLRLRRRGVRVLGIDFNPQAVRRWRSLGIDATFGDASDPEFLADLPLAGARWLVSTAPMHSTGLSHDDHRLALLQLAQGAGFEGRVAVTSHSPAETEALTAAGADLVLEPFQDAADRAVELLGGAVAEARTEIPEIDAEGRPAP
jgi:Kef-type K+ transport system membrane component KefB